MPNDILSFDFSEIQTSSGPSIADIPVDTPLIATVDEVEFGEFGGVGKFVLQQTIYLDPNDEEQQVQFKTYIGPKHGWLLAQYLESVGEDFRSLSGQGISATALKQVLVGNPLNVTFRESEYQKNGETRKSKQITRVKPG